MIYILIIMMFGRYGEGVAASTATVEMSSAETCQYAADQLNKDTDVYGWYRRAECVRK